MINHNEPGGSGRQFRVPGLAVAAVLVALLLGAGLGAFAYRERTRGHETKTGDPATRNTVALAAAGGEAVPFTGYVERDQGEPGRRYRAQFATDSMFPRFNPDRHYYVTRCVPGKVEVNVRAAKGSAVTVGPYPFRSGDFTAEARPLPGQEFTVGIKTGGQSDTYRVRCLPATFPVWIYERFSRPPQGMFLVSFRAKPTASSNNWVIVFDQDGTPRWWLNPVFNTLGGQVLTDGTVQFPRAFGDGFGRDDRTAQEIRSLDGKLIRTVRTHGAPTDGHEYVELKNGNALLVSYRPRYGVDLSSVGLGHDDGVLDGEIQEVNRKGKVVWRWNSSDHIPLHETPERWWRKLRQNPQPDYLGRTRYDIFHLNSVEPWGRNQLVISSRHTDRVYGISRRTGDVLWTVGGEYGPKSLTVLGDDPHDFPFGGQHDARMTGDVLSVHDNGTNLESAKRRPRLLRYRIDLKKRTATFISAVENPEVAPTSHCCGSVRPFGEGWLVAWGNNPVVSGYGPGDRLAFNLRIPTPVYRAVPVPASVSAKDFDRGLTAMEPGPPQSEQPVRPFAQLDPAGG